MLDQYDLTALLQRVEQGDRQAADELFRQVEPHLRAIAVQRKKDVPGSNLTTTGLVDLAFCKVIGKKDACWEDQRTFYGFISRKMMDLLIDDVRRARATIRGNGVCHVELQQDHAISNRDALEEDLDFLLDLQEALDQLQQIASTDVAIFRSRYVLGYTYQEVADLMGMSPTAVKRADRRAQLWLRRTLQDYANDSRAL